MPIKPKEPNMDLPYNASQYAGAKAYLEGLAGNKHSKVKPGQLQEMKDYLEKTRLTHETLSNAREQKNAEQRRINEKQIRGLRNTYRPAGGFLQQNNSALGGSSEGLPTKLGA